ncbi:MAG: putative acyltransferase [Planctomycetota bacterium]|nr:putative acyltransferase [Planctomycetota bacterium]
MVNSPKPRRPRYLSLDMMRGIACLFIVIHHTADSEYKRAPVASELSVSSVLLSATHWMSLGVPMFFVISGYCIAATSDSIRRRPTDHVQFFRRRFRRIYPPYYFAIAFQSAIMLLFNNYMFPYPKTGASSPYWDPTTLNVWQWLGNLTLTENWRWQFFGGPGRLVLGQAWTLCNEEQFYIIMGLILIFSPRSMFRASALVTVFSIAVYHVGVRYRLPIHGFFFDIGWLMFVAGVVVYHQVNYGPVGRPWAGYGLLLLGLAYAFGIGRVDLIASLSFAMILLALNPWDARIATSSWLRPFTFCGTICYSLYLTHVPIAMWADQVLYHYGVRGAVPTLCVTVPVGIACSVFVAWLFYLLVERKFINAPNTLRSAESPDTAVVSGPIRP